MAYFDTQKLYRKFGNEASVSNTGGEYKTYGPLRIVEVKIDLTTLTTSGNTILSDVVFFPKSVRIEEVEIETHTAATSSGSGTLNVGLVSQVDRTTEVDFDGLIAAEVKGTMDTAGKKVTYINGTSKAGALIGTTLATGGYLSAGLATAVYQTGVVYFRINYRAP